jgi:hypothetical protein
VLRHNQPIVNVVPGDFTQSGRLDLLVMSQPPSSRDQLDLSLYRAAVGGGIGEILDDFALTSADGAGRHYPYVTAAFVGVSTDTV